MKIFFDTEFLDDGDRLHLISIGLVRDDDKIYYAQSSNFDVTKASTWIKENVYHHFDALSWKFNSEIARDIREFVGERPDFWAYYADYDFVLLSKLYGTLLDRPEGWPAYCKDLRQLGDEVLKESRSSLIYTGRHHPLDEAIWCKEMYYKLIK